MTASSPLPPRDFFVAGGTLRYDAPSYVSRPADDNLYHLVRSGSLCYVLTTRQMGKSSLMNRLGQRLPAEGVTTALIDLTTIGTADLEAWYLSLLDDLHWQLALDTDAESWWQIQAALPPVKRFTKFFRDVVLTEVTGQVAVFIDEVDSALNLDYSDDFFAAIRAIYNQTLTSENAGRLSFVLLGVATPNELIKSQHRTPFNVGERIELEELELRDAQAVFAQGLPAQEPPIVDQVYEWTSGHPYLTQRICQAIARDNRPGWSTEAVDLLVAQLFFTDRSLIEESNLQFVNGRLLASPQQETLLRLYRKIYRQKKPVRNDERDPIQTELKLYGLVKVNSLGHLVVRNAIYRHVFDLVWIQQHQKHSWKRLSWAALIIITLLSIGISLYWRQQVQRSSDLLAQTYITNFQTTENATLRLDSLAQLLVLDSYGDKASALFMGLSTVEQTALFADPTADLQPQIERVIEALANTQVIDTGQTGADSTHVLTAMAAALQTFERLENPALLPEIESWLTGRTAVLQNDLEAALLAYSVAISLNDRNPATRYERAFVALALADYDTALTDLTALLAYDEAWQNRILHTIVNNSQLHPLIKADGSRFSDLTPFVPDPDATATLRPAVTEPEMPLSTSTSTLPPSPETTPAVATAVFITTPLDVPQTLPSGRIVYTCFVDGFDQICTINADGSNFRQHTFTSATNWTASWAPNLETILFSSSRTGTFALYEIAADENEIQLLIPPSPQGDYAPVASPDGRQITFTRAAGGSQNIWVMDRDGENAYPLTTINGDAIGPTWSPDGRQIAYSQRLADADNYTLVVVYVDGTGARTLPLPLEDIGGRSDWSPDGAWIAFYAGPPDNHDLYLAAADGTSYYRVTENGDNLGPSFSPDGNWLVFTSSRDGDNDLYRVRLDGTGLAPLTANESSDWQPYWDR